MPVVVFYMAVRNLGAIAAKFIDNGLSPKTPVAILEKGTLGHQRTIIGELASIGEQALVEAIDDRRGDRQRRDDAAELGFRDASGHRQRFLPRAVGEFDFEDGESRGVKLRGDTFLNVSDISAP